MKEGINKKFTDGNWKVGMKVIGEYNIKKHEIWNSKFYWVHEINNVLGKVRVLDKDNDVVSEWLPKSWFSPSYCLTTYRYQGSEITTPFNILQSGIMTMNEVYTAMSRARSLKQIHIQFTDKVFKREAEPAEATKIDLLKPKKGFIYLLTNDENNKIYVGKTDNLQRRFEEHLSTNDIIKESAKKWNQTLLSTVHYFREKDLLKIETNYIKLYHQNENYQLLNTQKVPKDQTFIKKINSGTLDERVAKMFKIEEGPNFFRIQVRTKERTIDIKRQYGARKTKEQAYEEITNERNKLTLEFF